MYFNPTNQEPIDNSKSWKDKVFLLEFFYIISEKFALIYIVSKNKSFALTFFYIYAYMDMECN
jgi:hypothetical protein